MNNQTALLLIAVGVLIAILFGVPSGESFASVPYDHGLETGLTASSVDCGVTPDAPACQPPPPVKPVSKILDTCVPSSGEWSAAGTGQLGRSTLASPCCQPPSYVLAKENSKGAEYKTCDDNLDSSDPLQQCVSQCCKFAASEANNYDPSWYPMARCACSLWCYNQDVPHFAKYGTAVHYISGDIAEAQTGDSGDFIDFGPGGTN